MILLSIMSLLRNSKAHNGSGEKEFITEHMNKTHCIMVDLVNCKLSLNVTHMKDIEKIFDKSNFHHKMTYNLFFMYKFEINSSHFFSRDNLKFLKINIFIDKIIKNYTFCVVF